MPSQNQLDGLHEAMALAWGWFLEKGQFEFTELSLEDQLSFATTYGHLDVEGLVKALKLLQSICEATRATFLNNLPTGGNA